jgi:hypothetical protein
VLQKTPSFPRDEGNSWPQHTRMYGVTAHMVWGLQSTSALVGNRTRPPGGQKLDESGKLQNAKPHDPHCSPLATRHVLLGRSNQAGGACDRGEQKGVKSFGKEI